MIYLLKVHNLVVFLIFMRLCNHTVYVAHFPSPTASSPPLQEQLLPCLLLANVLLMLDSSLQGTPIKPFHPPEPLSVLLPCLKFPSPHFSIQVGDIFPLCTQNQAEEWCLTHQCVCHGHFGALWLAIPTSAIPCSVTC